MSNSTTAFLTQLMGQVPVLIVYVIGAILALGHWRRCYVPALLTFLSMVLFLATTVLQGFAFVTILESRTDFGWSPETIATLIAVNGLTGSLFRAVAFGFLLAAVFVGRTAAGPSRFQDLPETEEPSPRSLPESGGTTRPDDGRFRSGRQ